MSIPLVRLIIYVCDIATVKAFYLDHFELPVVEEIDGDWVVLQAGGIELALHLMGARYRDTAASPTSSMQKGRRTETLRRVPVRDVRWPRSGGKHIPGHAIRLIADLAGVG